MRKVRPDSELASSVASVPQTAEHFGVDVATVRRWIVAGCPCLRRGQRGPGHGALLNIEDVAKWRGESASVGLTIDETLQRLAVALCETLTIEHVDIRAGVDRAAAAAVLLVAFDRCSRQFGKTYRFDQQPESIRALAREL